MSLDKVATALERYVTAWLAQVAAPGAAVVVTDATNTIHLSVHGYRDACSRTPLAEDDLLQIGSVSKAFASIAALRLQEQGRLTIDDPVTRHLPWFDVPSSYDPILLWHLMTHTAGIINGTDWTTEAEYEIRALRDSEATAPPGDLYHYSNAGYKTLGLVLEALWDLPVAQVLERELLAPLGMDSSLGRIANADRRLLAPPHVPFYDDRAWRPAHGLAPATWAESTTADGSICSTAGDMAHYLRMLLNRGRGDVAQVISEESFDLLVGRAVDSPEYEDGSRYGLGVLLTEDEGERYLRHGGSTIGYTCGMRVNVDAGLGVMVLTNGTADTAPVQRYAIGLVRAAIAGTKPPSPPPLPDATPDATRYVGAYGSPDGTIVVAANGGALMVARDGGTSVPLLRGDDEVFVPDGDEWEPFPLRFRGDGDHAVAITHGARVYTREDVALVPATGTDWAAFVGHYRAHDPWYSNFRIVDRGGALVLIWGWGLEERLEPLPDGSFRAGKDPRLPERVRFEDRADGAPVLRVNYSGLDLFRSFTA